MTRDAVRRAIRTFLYAFAAVLIPGALGWLNGLTEWARNDGQAPLPDARSLAFIGVAAVLAGVIAVVNLVGNLIEDAAGKAILRDVPPRQD